LAKIKHSIWILICCFIEPKTSTIPRGAKLTRPLAFANDSYFFMSRKSYTQAIF